MKNLAQTTVRTIAVLLLSFIFVQCKKYSDIIKFMELHAEKVNKQCPMSYGQYLTLDGCSVEENKTFKYSFTISDEVANKFIITDDMKPAFIRDIQNLPNFEQIAQYEISFLYSFYDSNKRFLSEIKITPEDYTVQNKIKDAAITKALEHRVGQIDNECPKNIGYGLTMNECTIDENWIIKYSFTVSNAAIEQMKITDNIKSAIIQELKKAHLPISEQSNQISYIYSYYNTNKKLLGEIKITPEDYK
jgi:hypothetical protein